MKGSMEGVLPMMALFIMAMVMAVQAIPLAESLANIVGDSTEDIERVVDTRAYTDFYFYNYIPLTAEYAVNDASYELGLEGGGYSWDNTWLDSNSFSQLYLEWVDTSDEKLNNEVDGGEGACVIPEVEYSVTPFDDPDAEDTKMSVFAGSVEGETPLQARCVTSSGETQYLSEDNAYSTSTYAVNNRYTNLAFETVEAFLSIQDELSDLSGNEYTGDGRTCQSDGDDSDDAEEEAEEEAKSNLESAVESAINSGLEGVPERGYLELLISPDENYYASNAGWDHISGNVRRDGITTSSFNCCNRVNGTCVDPGWEADATGSPDFVEMDWLIEDSEFEIIVNDSYETLQFDLSGSNSYEYDW